MGLTEQRRLMGLDVRPLGPWAVEGEPLEEALSPWATANKAVQKLEKVVVPWLQKHLAGSWRTRRRKMDNKGWGEAALLAYIKAEEGKQDWELHIPLKAKVSVELYWTNELAGGDDPLYSARIRVSDKAGQQLFHQLLADQSAAAIKDLLKLLFASNESDIAKALEPSTGQQHARKELLARYKKARLGLVKAKQKMDEVGRKLEDDDIAAARLAAGELQSLLDKESSAGKDLAGLAHTVLST